MKVRQLYYGTNNCKQTELSITTNRITQYVIVKRGTF